MIQDTLRTVKEVVFDSDNIIYASVGGANLAFYQEWINLLIAILSVLLLAINIVQKVKFHNKKRKEP